MANKREKIYERNPNTGVIRWRYTDESPDKFGWPNYGRILNEKKNSCHWWSRISGITPMRTSH